MKRLLNRRDGFTIVELVVVIAVVGILATITAVGFGKYQADGRDARRASSITVIAEALEKFYDQSGEYPSCSAVSAAAATVTKTTLVGVDPKALVAPQASGDNSIKCTSAGNTLTTTGADFFEYQGDGSPDCNGTGNCLQYTLKYKSEGTNQIISLPSRRNTSIATSGNITNLSVNTFDFTSLGLTWQAVQNATGYTVEKANDSNFTTGVVDTSSATNSATVSGLSSATAYYFRVKPIGVVGIANWSNTSTGATLALATPLITATANSNSQITVNWGSVANTVTYTLQYTTTGASWITPTPTSVTGISGASTSSVVTGLSTGVQYFFRLQAIAGANASNWSSTVTATTFVPAPATISATTNSSTQITANWSTVAVATSYTLQYSPTIDFSASVTSVPGLSTNSKVVTGLTQGLTYYFRAYALVGATSSVSSPTASATTTVDTPGSPSITAYRPGSVRAQGAGAWIVDPGAGNYYYANADASGSCPSGTNVRLQFLAYYDNPHAGDPSAASPAYTGDTATSTWYITQPYSGYAVKFGARSYCQGASAISAWSGWNYSCAANPGSNVACTF